MRPWGWNPKEEKRLGKARKKGAVKNSKAGKKGKWKEKNCGAGDLVDFYFNLGKVEGYVRRLQAGYILTVTETKFIDDFVKEYSDYLRCMERSLYDALSRRGYISAEVREAEMDEGPKETHLDAKVPKRGKKAKRKLGTAYSTTTRARKEYTDVPNDGLLLLGYVPDEETLYKIGEDVLLKSIEVKEERKRRREEAKVKKAQKGKVVGGYSTGGYGTKAKGSEKTTLTQDELDEYYGMHYGRS